MNILYFSDIHIETRQHSTRIPWIDIYPLDLCPRSMVDIKNEVDLVILAGDIGSFKKYDIFSGYLTGQDLLFLFLNQLKDFFNCPVIMIPGNHEYYGCNFEETRKYILNKKIKDIYILDRKEVILTDTNKNNEQIRILGTTLWTDYNLMNDQKTSMDIAKNSLNDHKYIKTKNGLFTPKDALKQFNLSSKWLMKKLDEEFNGKTVIVSHHVPHENFKNTLFKMSHISSCFYSNCDNLIEKAEQKNVSAWIFGHHHFNIEEKYKNIHFLSSQPGYCNERTGWNNYKIVKI